MKIVKEYTRYHDSVRRDYTCFFRIRCMNNNAQPMEVFKELKSLCEPESAYLNIHKLDVEGFYQENNIEYLKEETNNGINLIPIGLVDFICDDACDSVLKLLCYEKDNLYRVNSIIENIEKAIIMKYEALIVKQKCQAAAVYETSLD